MTAKEESQPDSEKIAYLKELADHHPDNYPESIKWYVATAAVNSAENDEELKVFLSDLIRNCTSGITGDVIYYRHRHLVGIIAQDLAEQLELEV